QRETEALGPLLLRIKQETGCALLVIEHDMPLITTISDQIMALELGHPLLQDVASVVVRDPRVVESYLGGDMAAIQRSGDGRRPAPASAQPSARRKRPLRAG